MTNSISPLPFSLIHCHDMSSTNDQPHCCIVLVPMSDNEHAMHEDEEQYASSTSEARLPDWAQATAHISPCSALVALTTHPTDPAAPHKVINGLINTIRFQQQATEDDIGLL